MVSQLPPFKRHTVFAALLALLGAHAVQAADASTPLLNPLFQDHAVLQRDQADPVWGHAKPHEAVTISFAGQDIHAQADAHGRWEASLPARAAGGPYTLTATTADGATQTIHDVLVGDVWLCSGQSNMVLQVKRALDARAEVQDASNDRIRVLTVDNVSSVALQESIPASDHWLKTTPDTVAEFSATCYFFARELQKDVPVPMGLIVAAWGGSRIEPWMSDAALRKVGGYDASLDLLAEYRKNPAHAGEPWSRLWQAWWRSRPGIAKNDEPWNPADVTDTGWLTAPIERGAWQHWGKPELANFTGMLWYRTTVTLTKAQAAQHATLNFTANEIDQTWVNGRWVGTGYGGGDLRAYAIPPGVLHEGKNLIAVNVLNTYRDGGIYGPASQRALHLADGSSVPLDPWQYQTVPSAYGAPPNVPWQSTSGLTMLYNGMIAPLGHYAFRGELWYQGESNTGDAGSYRKLLEAWRTDERARFGAHLPLLIAQLSSFGPASTHPGESGWADVREAQRLVAAEDPRSALAVSVDIGERYDIHPANKQELGRRLARAARHVVYGETLAPSGPTPVSAQQNGDTVTLSFDHVDGHLVAYSADHPIGFELCGAKAGSCYYALADIHGTQIVLHAHPSADSVTRVRYCWADSPICTLYDQAGLPASPFQLTITPTLSHP
ncbi:sialate O-acetylesterase [Dyella nitratireducens]|uniref:9-O-acetylesterase n=1 Tax=Dyella nitratireducens TaxID=1849580 RepID=A0ABQ1FQI4_9GAMM|nr:sialate O-acetylesterase [Dyella nitratireducens]GGA26659.1 9-O-acetylesterase [Dyella nitratireducens]GLQ43522.1 9-O-acetylesterase [Dyella nitratireducens]